MSQPIAADSSVLFHFAIKLEDGSVADSTALQGKPARLRMGDGSLTSSFEQCLLGLCEGERKSFTLAPEEAFGLSNPDNIYHLDRAKFGADVEPKVAPSSCSTSPTAASCRVSSGGGRDVGDGRFQPSPGRSHRHVRGGDPGVDDEEAVH